MRTLVCGDIHGCFRALKQVFERSNFDYDNDRLIVLGDVCDGWPEVYECVEELLKVKNLVYILGNHCSWALNYAIYGVKPEIWVSQGGKNTLESYRQHGGIPEGHINLFRNAPVRYVENNKLFVHGGIDPNLPLEKQDIDTFLWDRNLLQTAMMKGNRRPDYRLTKFDDIFIGHTTTQRYNTVKPLHCCEIWAVDQGAGWSGKLTLMDVDSKEYVQSDFVTDLYPGVIGRGG